MKVLLAMVATLAACGPSASEMARRLDPGARCVSRTSALAFCELTDGRQVICDSDRCLYVLSPGLIVELPSGAKGDR